MEGEELKSKIRSIIESDCEIFVGEYPNELGWNMWYAILRAKQGYPNMNHRQVEFRVDGNVATPYNKEAVVDKFVEGVYKSIQKGEVRIDENRLAGFGFAAVKIYDEIHQTQK